VIFFPLNIPDGCLNAYLYRSLKCYNSVNLTTNWIIPCLMFYLVTNLTRRFRITLVWVVAPLETWGFSYSKIFLQDFSTLNIFFFLTKEYFPGLILYSWGFLHCCIGSYNLKESMTRFYIAFMQAHITQGTEKPHLLQGL